MKLSTNKKGFTLIEIVIVLAIAALILVAIFLAVRGAQQSRRDAHRRTSAGIIGALVEESAGNHGGCYPTQTCGSQIGASSGTFNAAADLKTQPPDAANYTFAAVSNTLVACPTGAATVNEVRVSTNAARQWRVAIGLESRDWFCADNL